MPVSRISPEETKELLDSDDGYVYIDVRTEAEFHAGHVPGAKNIPVFERGPMGMQPNPDFLKTFEGNFSKDAKCIVGCQKGGRSLQAAQMLMAAGFTNVVDMAGGFGGAMDPGGNVQPGWTMLGYPTSTESDPEDRHEALRAKVGE